MGDRSDLDDGAEATTIERAGLEPVDDAALLTPDWVARALGRPGAPVEVRAVTATAVGTGQMGSSYRLAIDSPTPGVPTTVVAKLPSPDEAVRAMVAPGYAAEIGFYRDLADDLAVAVPRCHAVATNDDCSVFVLVMEDLAPAVQGDQLSGASAEQAGAAVRNLAGLHGPRWCDPTLAELDFLSPTDPATAAFLGELTVSATETFVERYQGRLADEDAALLREATPLLGGWLQARAERFSVIHGDYRMDNLLLGPDGRVTAVDWQTVALGLPGRDLAYFLSTSLTVDDRRRSEEELVGTYHRALVAQGVEDHPLDECLDDYRFGLLHGPLIVVLGAAYGTPTERGDAMFLTMTERYCAAIRDHGTLELVRAETAA